MPKFDLSQYETVEDRLVKFWADHPQGRVATDLVAYGDKQFIVRAEVYFDKADQHPTATGYAEELVGATPVNKTSALENCETSAIGRALANCNYATHGKRPSREEMDKAQRGGKPAPTPTLDAKEMVNLLGVINHVATVEDDNTLRDLWTSHDTVLDVTHPESASTLREAILARKAELEGAA